LAYRFASRHARDERFTFGTGKVGELAAFTSAVILAMIAVAIGYEGGDTPVCAGADRLHRSNWLAGWASASSRQRLAAVRSRQHHAHAHPTMRTHALMLKVTNSNIRAPMCTAGRRGASVLAIVGCWPAAFMGCLMDGAVR